MLLLQERLQGLPLLRALGLSGFNCLGFRGVRSVAVQDLEFCSLRLRRFEV